MIHIVVNSRVVAFDKPMPRAICDRTARRRCRLSAISLGRLVRVCALGVLASSGFFGGKLPVTNMMNARCPTITACADLAAKDGWELTPTACSSVPCSTRTTMEEAVIDEALAKFGEVLRQASARMLGPGYATELNTGTSSSAKASSSFHDWMVDEHACWMRHAPWTAPRRARTARL
jgi:hypothetical protein